MVHHRSSVVSEALLTVYRIKCGETEWAVHKFFGDPFRAHVYQQTVLQIHQHLVMKELCLVSPGQSLGGLEFDDRSLCKRASRKYVFEKV